MHAHHSSCLKGEVLVHFGRNSTFTLCHKEEVVTTIILIPGKGKVLLLYDLLSDYRKSIQLLLFKSLTFVQRY